MLLGTVLSSGGMNLVFMSGMVLSLNIPGYAEPLPPQDVDTHAAAVRRVPLALHPAGEHHHPDVLLPVPAWCQVMSIYMHKKIGWLLVTASSWLTMYANMLSGGFGLFMFSMSQRTWALCILRYRDRGRERFSLPFIFKKNGPKNNRADQNQAR